MNIKNNDLIFWKIDCKNRTRLAYTNKNHNDFISENELEIIQNIIQKKCDLICFSSSRIQSIINLIKSYDYFFYQIRHREYQLNRCKSIDPRIEYITIFSFHRQNLLYLKELYQNSFVESRNFKDFFVNYNFNGNNNFTDTQKFVQKCYLERNINEKTFYICGTNSKKFAQENRNINCQMKYDLLFIYNHQKWNKATVLDFVKMRNLPTNYSKFNLKTLKAVVHPKFCLYK
jgi:hypothetical protein